jgi:glycosyltransferase involved in cell wall biosynthesis
MKVVLLSYHFPPAPDVGGLRAAKLAESFLVRGDSVLVIAAPLPAGLTDPPERHPRLAVRRIAPSLDPRALYHRWRGRSDDRAVLAAGGGTLTWTPPTRVSFLRRQISSALWLPDDRQGWILPAARYAARIARNGADLLYSTAPPFSVHLAALHAHRRTRVPWVAEFRDPWIDNPWKPSFVRSGWSDAVERWLERRTHEHAHTIVAVTDSAAAAIRERLPAGDSGKVIVVRNGIDALERARAPRGPVRHIAYAGNLYHGRDPRPLLDAVAALARQGRVHPDLRIDFIGHCRAFLGQSVEAYAAERGLAGTVRFVDTVPHDECMRRLREADLLLLLAQNQPLQVPNKLYEYLGMRTPILAFVDAEGETARMLREVNGNHIVDRDDPALIERVVGEALDSQAAPTRDDALLHEWTTRVQFERLHSRLVTVRP